ncbi:MAG: helix-turn-helix domain-containing protein [Defluviitaleaceae bacterium]|nr:helix-turn-helix domain-containing protein [Defluviitaleaceae bacterium]
METYERIRQVRNALGLSQARFSKRMAISSSYLADIELNNKSVSERIIRLLSAEFNVNSGWLRTGEGVMFNEGMDEQISKLISAFNSLNQPFKKYALNQIEELVDLYNQNKT